MESEMGHFFKSVLETHGPSRFSEQLYDELFLIADDHSPNSDFDKDLVHCPIDPNHDPPTQVPWIISTLCSLIQVYIPNCTNNIFHSNHVAPCQTLNQVLKLFSRYPFDIKAFQKIIEEGQRVSVICLVLKIYLYRLDQPIIPSSIIESIKDSSVLSDTMAILKQKMSNRQYESLHCILEMIKHANPVIMDECCIYISACLIQTDSQSTSSTGNIIVYHFMKGFIGISEQINHKIPLNHINALNIKMNEEIQNMQLLLDFLIGMEKIEEQTSLAILSQIDRQVRKLVEKSFYPSFWDSLNSFLRDTKSFQQFRNRLSQSLSENCTKPLKEFLDHYQSMKYETLRSAQIQLKELRNIKNTIAQLRSKFHSLSSVSPNSTISKNWPNRTFRSKDTTFTIRVKYQSEIDSYNDKYAQWTKQTYSIVNTCVGLETERISLLHELMLRIGRSPEDILRSFV